MSTTTLASIAARVRLADPPVVGASDRDLLARFLGARDEASFETLLRRHSRLVRSAVARVLPPGADADDAFQATFLLLLRRAGSVDWGDNLGPWLYGVAHRVAVKARDAARTRARKERDAGTQPGSARTPADFTWCEACAILHDELDRLPDRYRLPLLLCYLEGRTRDEAAAALGLTLATLKRRLERGRGILRTRLDRRGVALSAGLLAALAAPPARAGGGATLAAALAVARGSVPARVRALARAATATALLSKVVATTSLAAGLLAVGSVLLAAGVMPPAKPVAGSGAAPINPPAADPTRKEAAAPAATADVTIKGKLVAPGKDGAPGTVPADITVAVWADGMRVGTTTTAADGTFHLTVPGPLPGGAVVVATKADIAPDWAAVPADPDRTPVVLSAVAAEGNVSGRVTDLEGRPLGNVPVDVNRLGRPPRGRTLADLVKPPAGPTTPTGWRPDLDWVPAEAAGLPAVVTTDADGRFKLTGVGKDRAVQVTARGTTTEHLRVSAVTRPLDPGAERPGPFGLHGESFTMRVGPARPITGTVRDAKTGDPVPGMRVADLVGDLCEATTDRGGRFTLTGVRRSATYQVGAWSPGDAPYFDANARLDDPPRAGGRHGRPQGVPRRDRDRPRDRRGGQAGRRADLLPLGERQPAR